MTRPMPPSEPSPAKTRWLVGALTVWPVAYVILFFAVAVRSVVTGGDEGIGTWLFLLHIATMLLMFGLLAVYAVDIFRNVHVREDRRLMWLLLILFVNIGAMPIYWWHYMRAPTASTSG